MAVAEYIEYAKERARWWSKNHPHLRDEITATAMFALVQAFERRIPEYPKAYVSMCIQNAVVDMLENNYIIKIPRSEIRRRKEKGESLDTLPRAKLIDDGEIRDLQRARIFPTWMKLQVKDIYTLLGLSDREKRILELRIEGYTNEEVGLEFSISEAAIRKAIGLIRGRYLTLLQTTRGLLKPNE